LTGTPALSPEIAHWSLTSPRGRRREQELFGRIAANKVTEPVGLAREAGFLPGVGSTATRRLPDGHAGATVIARGQPPGDVR